MKITLSVIKADIGSIAGHMRPSDQLMASVRKHIKTKGKFLKDFFVSYTGDDVAILMTHTKGEDNSAVHKLAWDAFIAGTKTAKQQGLYGAGQDLLKDAFSGNVKGMGPAVAEIEMEERAHEPFMMLAADKTEPGAYNLPFYLAFADPMYNAGLLLSPSMTKGFTFEIMDVMETKKEKVISLNAPEDLYYIAALLRDNSRYVLKAIYSRDSGLQAAALSTTRLHNIAGKYTGKDDPVALVRGQKQFPSIGETLHPFGIAHYVAGFMRGSHNGPLMPVKMNSAISGYFDGPPVVCAHGFCVHNGKLTEPVDLFAGVFWDHVRTKACEKAMSIREQGFSGPAMLPYSELEYGGIVDILKTLEKRFKS